jgi:membrane protease YdiL (CAAX protease family)
MYDNRSPRFEKLGPLTQWAANLGVIGLSIVLFWWLAELAMERHLLSQTAYQQQQLQQGWRWEMDQLSDLVGRSATRLKNLELVQGQLLGYRDVKPGFLSLDFRGRRLDAKIHHMLQIRIWLERPALLGIFHSEVLGGPVLSTATVDLMAGWQLVELDLAQRPWQANIYRNQKRVSGPEPATWGGEFGIVSSLRIHPSMGSANHFKIDWVRLLPSEPTPWAHRPRVELTSFDFPLPEKNHSGLRAPLFFLPEQIASVERILAFRDQIGQRTPSASLLPSSSQGLADPATPDPRRSWLALEISILTGLTGLAATVPGRQRFSERSLALAQLAGLLGLAASLLTWADNEVLEDPGLAVTLALLAALMVALLFRAREQLIPNLKSTSRAWSDTSRLIIATLVPLFILVVLNDQLSPPTLAEMLPRFGSYLIWATLQQMVLCIVLLSIMKRLKFRKQPATLAATVLFGMAHFPNFALMVGTLILAQLCLWLYQRHDSLLPGIALHAILGTLYLESMPETLLRSGAIGERFFF